MKKVTTVLITVILVLVLTMNVCASSVDSVIAGIKSKAESDKYRFILVDQKGITAEIKKSLADNDKMYLSSAPIGSVKVSVIDADTGKPVANAQCLLSFSTSRVTVNADGSKEQIANPFLLFNLSQTPSSGELTFSDTYFYSTRLIEPGAKPFFDRLTVSAATLVDQDPQLTINLNAKNYIATSDPTNFQAIVSQINGRTTLKFSELKAIIKAVASPKYAEILRSFFDDQFAIYSANVKVKVSDAPQYAKLIAAGKQELTIAELRTYIDQNRDLFKQHVVARYYADLGGFEPDFAFDYEPEFESVTTYKDGTKKASTSTPYLAMKLFDKSTGGTGYAVNTSGFSYKAYVYASGYKEGLAIGSAIRQDHVDKNLNMKIYLSKESSPVVVPEKSNVIFGSLKDSKNAPIVGATIQIQDTELKAVTNAEGQFSFPKLTNEKVKLTIINPENGTVLPAKAVLGGKEYALDRIPIELNGENKVYQIALIGGSSVVSSGSTQAGGIATAAPDASQSGSSMTTGSGDGPSIWVIILIAVALIGAVILWLFLTSKKKKRYCTKCGDPVKADVKFCGKCGSAV